MEWNTGSFSPWMDQNTLHCTIEKSSIPVSGVQLWSFSEFEAGFRPMITVVFQLIRPQLIGLLAKIPWLPTYQTFFGKFRKFNLSHLFWPFHWKFAHFQWLLVLILTSALDYICVPTFCPDLGKKIGKNEIFFKIWEKIYQNPTYPTPTYRTIFKIFLTILVR